MNEMEVIQSKIYELRGQRVMFDIAEYHFYITGHQGNIRVVAFIYGRQWNVMKRLGYDYLESPTGKLFKK